MTITNGYSTLAEYKAYVNIKTTETTDDGVIEQLIEKASRFIDGYTGRTFYARTETHLYDVPDDSELWLFSDDLLTITTLTNGNGDVITSTDYLLRPANTSPKYSIALKASSSKYWASDSNGNTEQVISIAGSWGYASATPADIKGACFELVKHDYGKRSGQNTSASAQVTAAGVVLTPEGIPSSVRQTLNRYRRLT